MRQLLLILIIAFVFEACGVQRQLQKAYVGKPVSVLKSEFGYPKTILDRNEGDVYVFEEVKNLKSTEISQGKLTLDPMVSPRVQKTIRYYFTVRDSVIVNAKMEEEYER